ncbi:MAG: TraB/GumN family protein [Betaproteobacteria bacterium]|nr:TraB/GumN family protein [Betaproteobacteria bacterium]
MQIRMFMMACALCVPGIGPANAQSDHTPAPVVLEKMIVSGEQPGPGMWRVSKGDHVLWIVGTQTPVPKKMTWRAKGVEAIVAQAQEVLTQPSVSVSTKQIGFFTALFLIPSAMDARKNPDGATLRDVVPADLYKRWLLLRNKYIGEYKIDDEENDIERWRPMFAALHLYRRAIEELGMTSNNPVWTAISDAAKKHKVKTTDVSYYPAISEPRAAINQLKSSRLADLDCLAKTVERIENDLDAMRTRANAWAKGDIDAIRKLPATDQRAACEEAIRNASFMKTLGMQDIAAQVENTWLTAADAALAKNMVTLATLPITRMVAADGYLAKLRARGYTVLEPDSATE